MSEIQSKRANSESSLRRFKAQHCPQRYSVEVQARARREKPSQCRKKVRSRPQAQVYNLSYRSAMPPFSITVFTQGNGRTGSAEMWPRSFFISKNRVALCPPPPRL